MSNYNQSLIEDYKQTIERLQKECTEKTNTIIALGEQLKAEEQECEQIKEKYEALKLENEEGYEIVDELKQECEKLKEKLRELELKNTTLQNRNQQLDGATLEAIRYCKALEKIEGLVKNFCKDCDDYEDCNWEKEGCYYSLIPNLKDIIHKAKGEGNE